jgi:ABC-type branched-subunit amino acid transport system ATPase component
MSEPRRAGAALEVTGMTVNYGGFRALSDVGLRVDYGSVRAVIGPNGAGKTTLAGSIFGEVDTTSGRVIVAGTDVTGMPTWKRARHGLGRGYQVARVFDTLTVRSNIEVAGTVRRGERKAGLERAEVALELTELRRVAQLRPPSLSAGDRKRLELAVLVAQDAKIMVLDEPTAGMSAAESELMGRLIAHLAQRGAGVLIIEHDLDLVFSLADAVTVLSQGKVIFAGGPQEALRSAVVRDVYLHDRSELGSIEPAAGTQLPGTSGTAAADTPAPSTEDEQ